jgi:hypothetical protein
LEIRSFICLGWPGPWSICLFFLPTLGQAHITKPSYWLRYVSQTFLPRLALNHNPPNLSLPSN